MVGIVRELRARLVPLIACLRTSAHLTPPATAAIFDGSLSPMFEIDGTAELTILKWNEPMAKV